MAKHIFIWVAHPAKDSFCNGLANTYQKAAELNGAEIRRQNLAEMSFDIGEYEGYNGKLPPLEADLVTWQENITWANHLLIVHPYWWGAMPAKAKAVFDRALTPDFGFKYHKKGMGWDKLLKGRTADAIVTSDTPPLIDTLIYRKPGRNVIKNQVLGFCGIKTKNILQFGSVKMANKKKINGWISQTAKLGTKAAA